MSAAEAAQTVQTTTLPSATTFPYSPAAPRQSQSRPRRAGSQAQTRRCRKNKKQGERRKWKEFWGFRTFRTFFKFLHETPETAHGFLFGWTVADSRVSMKAGKRKEQKIEFFSFCRSFPHFCGRIDFFSFFLETRETTHAFNRNKISRGKMAGKFKY